MVLGKQLLRMHRVRFGYSIHMFAKIHSQQRHIQRIDRKLLLERAGR